jgi:hypothetical protein
LLVGRKWRYLTKDAGALVQGQIRGAMQGWRKIDHTPPSLLKLHPEHSFLGREIVKWMGSRPEADRDRGPQLMQYLYCLSRSAAW